METGRFPNKLKIYRHCAGYSQKKVAKLLGFADTGVISRWESGMRMPSMVQVFRLSKIYETLPHVLFEDLWNQSGSKESLLAHEEPFNSNESCCV